jgi:hypothetical protein
MHTELSPKGNGDEISGFPLFRTSIIDPSFVAQATPIFPHLTANLEFLCYPCSIAFIDAKKSFFKLGPPFPFLLFFLLLGHARIPCPMPKCLPSGVNLYMNTLMFSFVLYSFLFTSFFMYQASFRPFLICYKSHLLV